MLCVKRNSDIPDSFWNNNPDATFIGYDCYDTEEGELDHVVEVFEDVYATNTCLVMEENTLYILVNERVEYDFCESETRLKDKCLAHNIIFDKICI